LEKISVGKIIRYDIIYLKRKGGKRWN